MAGIAASVIAGLAAGVAFILVMTTSMYEMQQNPYISKGNSPRSELHITDSGWVLLETSRIEDNNYNRHIINTLLKNSTIAELLEGEQWLVFGLGGETHCSFGSCTLSRLDNIQNRTNIIHFYMDPTNDRVFGYYEQ